MATDDDRHRPLSWRLLLPAGMLLAVAALAAVALALHRRSVVYTDADTIREPASTAALRDILWQPPAALPEPLNAAIDDYEPRLSGDGQELFFVRGRPDHNADIYVSRRSGGQWTAPEPLAGVNSP